MGRLTDTLYARLGIDHAGWTRRMEATSACRQRRKISRSQTMAWNSCRMSTMGTSHSLSCMNITDAQIAKTLALTAASSRLGTPCLDALMA